MANMPESPANTPNRLKTRMAPAMAPSSGRPISRCHAVRRRTRSSGLASPALLMPRVSSMTVMGMSLSILAGVLLDEGHVLLRHQCRAGGNVTLAIDGLQAVSGQACLELRVGFQGGDDATGIRGAVPPGEHP